MKIKFNKLSAQAVTMLTVSLMAVMQVYASGWQHDSIGRWYATNVDCSNWYANGWQWIDDNNDGIAECYYFGTDGYLYENKKTPDGYDVNDKGEWTVNGVIQTKAYTAVGNHIGAWYPGTGENAGKWQWLNADGSLLKEGWYWLDGNLDGTAECYYFDENGWMFANKQTPDGFTVNADGAWVENGIIQTKSVTKTSGIGSRIIGGGTSSGGSSNGSSSGRDSGNSPISDNNDSSWKNYSDNSVSKAANDFKNGNKGMMSSDEWQETKDAIQDFKDQYITDKMTDFEKEIKIIEWLVANCSYETGDNWERAMAYSCIVRGKAQCSGYADAFLQTAKLCGLDVRYIHNSTHAWNLIKLDNDWYHVDVTWEDPINQNKYGFGNLRNKYINLEDEQIINVASHKNWNPSSIKAKGTKYGPLVVKEYLESGNIDTSAGEKYRDSIDNIYNSVSQDENSILISYTDVNDTANKIVQYLSKRIEERRYDYRILIRFGNKFKSNVIGDYTKLRDAKTQITDIVNQEINNKYSSILNSPVRIFLSIENGYENEYYCTTEKKNIYYKQGNGLKVPYTVHFICERSEIASYSSNGELNECTVVDLPENYEYLNEDKYELVQGNGSCSRHQAKDIAIYIKSRTELEINVPVHIKMQKQNSDDARSEESNKIEMSENESDS